MLPCVCNGIQQGKHLPDVALSDKPLPMSGKLFNPLVISALQADIKHLPHMEFKDLEDLLRLAFPVLPLIGILQNLAVFRIAEKSLDKEGRQVVR